MTTDRIMEILCGPPKMRPSGLPEGMRQDYPENRDPVICADGFKVSIQASEFHYCDRFDQRHNRGDYHYFELGFPSSEDDLIQEHAEDPEKPTQTVYGYVPKDTVRALIEKHGGPADVCDTLQLGALSGEAVQA